jgi:hypothetical protein
MFFILYYTVFLLFKWLCWMETLLWGVDLERITSKYIYFNICYNEQGSRTDYVSSSIPHYFW